MNICLIPARIGSKRLKKKNIINFYGKPLISHVIAEIQKSKIFDEIIVSTDSKIIKDISIKSGAKIYFKRPKKLCSDQSTTSEIINHSIKYLQSKNIKINNLCCIYPTAILLTSQHIKKSFYIFKKNKKRFLFSAQKFDHPIQRAIIRKKRGIKFFNKFFLNTQSNNLPTYYHDAGQFYWGCPEQWLKNNSIFQKNSVIYPLERYEAVDINVKEDLELAKILFKLREKNINENKSKK